MRKNKAHRLMKVAFATYHKGEKSLARDIFVLAMEDPSAGQEFGFGPTADELQGQLDAAVAAGDFDAASDLINSLKSLKGNGESVAEEVMVEEEPDLDLGDEEEEEEEEMLEDEGEASLSPGDMVPPPPMPELAPAQVASLVTLARKVKRGGHPDLAKKITKALGL